MRSRSSQAGEENHLSQTSRDCPRTHVESCSEETRGRQARLRAVIFKIREQHQPATTPGHACVDAEDIYTSFAHMVTLRTSPSSDTWRSIRRVMRTRSSARTRAAVADLHGQDRTSSSFTEILALQMAEEIWGYRMLPAVLDQGLYDQRGRPKHVSVRST